MSSINSIGNTTPQKSVLTQLLQPKPATAQTAAAATALQEANETDDVTRQEAAKGDQVAIRKLAKHQKPQHTAATTKAPTSVLDTGVSKPLTSGGFSASA